jgi:hypothetical protein
LWRFWTSWQNRKQQRKKVRSPQILLQVKPNRRVRRAAHLTPTINIKKISWVCRVRLARFVEVVNVNRRKSRKPLFHVPIIQISSNENCYTEFGFKIKTLKRRSTGTLRWATNSTAAQYTPYKLRDFKRLRDFWTRLRGLPWRTLQLLTNFNHPLS